VERERGELKSRVERLEQSLSDSQSKQFQLEANAAQLEESLRRAELAADQYKNALQQRVCHSVGTIIG